MYFNANCGIGISVTEIQTILHIWACCNQIQQYFPFIILCYMANAQQYG